MSKNTTAAKPATGKPKAPRKRVTKPKAEASVQTPAQAKRVKAALEGKNLRQVTFDINNKFPETRTADLNIKLLQILRGQLWDETIVAEIEALDITEEITD